jgi:hypothetical protein
MMKIIARGFLRLDDSCVVSKTGAKADIILFEKQRAV